MAIYDDRRKSADDAKIGRDFPSAADDRSTRSPFMGFLVVALLVVLGWFAYDAYRKSDATTLRETSPMAVPSTKPLTQQPTVPSPAVKPATPAPTTP